MEECPKSDLLNQRKLDPEGGIEDTMRTIHAAPFAIDDQDAVASLNEGKGIDTFASSQVKSNHPDIRKWTPAIHQVTLWIGTPRSGFGAKARKRQRDDDQDWGAGGWREVRSGGGSLKGKGKSSRGRGWHSKGYKGGRSQ